LKHNWNRSRTWLRPDRKSNFYITATRQRLRSRFLSTATCASCLMSAWSPGCAHQAQCVHRARRCTNR